MSCRTVFFMLSTAATDLLLCRYGIRVHFSCRERSNTAKGIDPCARGRRYLLSGAGPGLDQRWRKCITEGGTFALPFGELTIAFKEQI
jgi:hypothetical protein